MNSFIKFLLVIVFKGIFYLDVVISSIININIHPLGHVNCPLSVQTCKQCCFINISFNWLALVAVVGHTDSKPFLFTIS